MKIEFPVHNSEHDWHCIENLKMWVGWIYLNSRGFATYCVLLKVHGPKDKVSLETYIIAKGNEGSWKSRSRIGVTIFLIMCVSDKVKVVCITNGCMAVGDLTCTATVSLRWGTTPFPHRLPQPWRDLGSHFTARYTESVEKSHA